MTREQNFLLGRGERLAGPVRVPSGGGDKNPPYSLADALGRLAPQLRQVTASVAALPDEALVGDEAVVAVTMHPRYVAKSDFPQSLLSAFGLRSIGSRSRVVAPENWGIKRHGETGIGEDLFVAGKKSAFQRWQRQLEQWGETRQASRDLQHVEDVRHPSPQEKLVGPISEGGLLEVVLHNGTGRSVVDAFARFADHQGAEPLLDLRRDVGGLTFLPVRVHSGAVELARFSFVRTVRAMPRIRPLRPTRGTGGSRGRLVLPDTSPAGGLSRAVVFDGGIPDDVREELRPWVTLIEPDGIGPADRELEEHGLAVTGALLFGPAGLGSPLDGPVCAVDHVRVFDQDSDSADDAAAYVILNRIADYLKANAGKYRLANVSLGPEEAVEDDDVSLWTSTLDALVADGCMVMAVAAGNDGDLDRSAGLHRVQPPADGVNVLAVGAADRQEPGWARADYSSFGPGRSPGLVKPDGLAFGGDDAGRPFPVVGRGLRLDYMSGTSFAAPYALRSAAAIDHALGDQLAPLAIRALLIHRAERADEMDWREVGWGLFSADSTFTLTCDDDEAVVVFQGDLPIGEHLRLPVPMPSGGVVGPMDLVATLVIASEVDAEHAASYTRSGLEIAFRPRASRVRVYRDGRTSAHATTQPFFSSSRLYGQSEAELRAEAHKWELVRRGARSFRVPLEDPVFDVYYHSREDARRAAEPPPVQYAFVLGMKAPSMLGLYNEVVRTYARVLEPLRPQVRLQVPGA